MEIINAKAYRKEVIALLTEAGLPFKDLPEQLDSFIVAIADGSIIGAAGLEVYGKNGLLRSVVVASKYQKQGIAGQLLLIIEQMAMEQGLSCLVLLTETAPAYFEGKGFERVQREAVPPDVKASSEFSSVCPTSANVLSKSLIKS